ncbi:hypothetical protein BN946_scf184903.g9 [Trametes cinnabarina]|uniref:Uncharacterized protein n=1 Tax=Pycnoporus cinnabarinus TaxID=5643 RepID=A0A060SWM2_PYCCI|nr:hypothetical protein BN946_scf184903.g9 [Trametes cinnabarina]
MAPVTRSASFLAACSNDSKTTSKEPDAASMLEDARQRVRANSSHYATAAHLWRSHAFYGPEEAQALQEEYSRRVALEKLQSPEAQHKAARKAHSAHAPESGDEMRAPEQTLALETAKARLTHGTRRDRPMGEHEPTDHAQDKPARKRALTVASPRPQKKAHLEDRSAINEVHAQNQQGAKLA